MVEQLRLGQIDTTSHQRFGAESFSITGLFVVIVAGDLTFELHSVDWFQANPRSHPSY